MILDSEKIQKKIKRMALEIAERNYNEAEILLIGIARTGMLLAQSVHASLKGVFPGKTSLLELTMDKRNPTSIQLSDDRDLAGKTIVLIDDVANSGRTMLYALKPLLKNFPAKIETLALVERAHKQFPIEVNYVGIKVSTTKDEYIAVLTQGDEITGAEISAKN